MLKGYIRFGLLPVAGDLQWDKLEKQVFYCSFNEHLHIVYIQFCFSFFSSAQVDLFWLKNTHTDCTALTISKGFEFSNSSVGLLYL